MTKNKSGFRALPAVTKPSPAAAPAAPAKPQPADVYSFPTKVRCPRCDSVDTSRTSAYREKQYRRCNIPICRFQFSITGTKI